MTRIYSPLDIPDPLDKQSLLYLRPGSYRLHASDINGNTLNEQTLQMSSP